jgi:putative transposase
MAGQDRSQDTVHRTRFAPWENDYCVSFNSKLRDEFLNGEIFYSMKELCVLAEPWSVHYNRGTRHP